MSDAPDTEYLTEWFKRHRTIGHSARRLADGERFAGYVVLGLLGHGGSSEVYRALPETGREAVALKILREDRPELAARMRREAEILAAHPHSALPRLIASGEEQGRPWLVVEELVPQDLPSSDEDVARFLLALCDGVDHLHRLGLVHRDIKPGNILFRADGSPVLIDLGLVKDMAEEDAAPTGESDSITSGSAVGVGTPGFSAPEQFAGGKVSPATDVYALGVLADECFGHRPPKCWRALLRRATSALTAERPVSAGELAKAIRRRHLPPLSVALTALMLAGSAVLAGFVLSRPAPGEGPWRLEPLETPNPYWNTMLTDGNWRLAAFAEDGVVRIKPDYSNGDGLLDLTKPITDGEGRMWSLASIGFPPLAKDNPVLSHDEVRLVGDVKGVLLPDTLVELGSGAFMNCGFLAEISLPPSLRTIGPWSFSGCNGLRHIVIPAGVEDISDDRTFMDCAALEMIDVEEGNPEYRSDDGVLLSADGQRLIAYPAARGGRYDIPDGVAEIPAHLFVNCKNLAEVSIPASVHEIGRHAFSGCTALTNLLTVAGTRIRIQDESFRNTGLKHLPFQRVD